jgi:hypothetical protein
MSEADPATQLWEQGVVLLRGVFAKGPLARLREAAAPLFEAVEREPSSPERYRFNRFSHSSLLTSLRDFGCASEELVEPLAAPGLGQLFSEVMGCAWACNMEQSWVRKKFAPHQAPVRDYHLQGWHQDGALGVHFPPQPGPTIPMKKLLTCWISLNACGIDSPGLEFVRRRQAGLLHFTELDDLALRRRFAAEDFWAPELELGDGLVFLNSVLHRTYALEQMQGNRLSVEYRVLPGV